MSRKFEDDEVLSQDPPVEPLRIGGRRRIGANRSNGDDGTPVFFLRSNKRAVELHLDGRRLRNSQNGLCYGVGHVPDTGRLLPPEENITPVAPNLIWSLPDDGGSPPSSRMGSHTSEATDGVNQVWDDNAAPFGRLERGTHTFDI
jgi:hypothetical protein